MNTTEVPHDGLKGLIQNWKTDALAGFLVFLLALPLSLGVAKASEFPASMGVLTAMIGGLIVSFFAGSRLTIKGPAAGLITICAGAVMEMGGGTQGWHYALGAVFVAALIQILLGWLGFGSLSDFFPPSAVHGMLAAIGLIIFSKQIHILLGIDPELLKGKEPLELFSMIPESILHEDVRVTFVGVVSLIIIFGMPLLKNKWVKKMPAPMVVLLVTIPMALVMDFKHTEPAFDMVKIGDFWQHVGVNIDFGMIGTFIFWKYVLMFLFVNSLETVLTVKAIDGLDPWKRISNANKDLSAVGVGNALSAVLGGVPMISEVARSSANISFGGRTVWANFFHGLFLLLAMLLLIPVIEMIPNTALAALLIAVGYRLASPNEFFKTYKIGSEQLMIFVVTIVVTIATDLLLGVAVGVLTKLLFNALNGVSFKSLFRAHCDVTKQGEEYVVTIYESAVFSNLPGFKKAFAKLDLSGRIVVDFTNAYLLDHTFMEFLHHFEEQCTHRGGSMVSVGFDRFRPFSNHPLAARKAAKDADSRLEIRLSPRQAALRKMAEVDHFAFYPQRVRNLLKFKAFPIEAGHRIQFEENLLIKYIESSRIEVSDVTLTDGARQVQNETSVTIVYAADIEVPIPDFALEPEHLWTRMSEFATGKDIDFSDQPQFSKKYYLRGADEAAVRAFFNDELLGFLASHDDLHIEAHRNKLILYLKRDLLTTEEIRNLLMLTEDFLSVISKKKQP